MGSYLLGCFSLTLRHLAFEQWERARWATVRTTSQLMASWLLWIILVGTLLNFNFSFDDRTLDSLFLRPEL